MKTKNFKITGEYIELIKLLKASGLCAMGSDAKYCVSNGNVKLNGNTELRLRAKVRPGDKVELDSNEVVIE
ncbi:MAG: RNA-binding S4 domain-containing protein [Bacteroidetes bacterium]|jgi:ribosome-associated protein|nr:RNA-binding S4 domain-containing protein [Bacteroidota bacterium]MBK9670666.1 RNA-binding S4 domain-containing protein [Bacteroidota bacterium]MBK9799840.1 RNA-binding S4 domain-containing protein [Bacteroidota bacterium]MBP6412846.1 RNA-binding S4 domain-containing protein [Bacteroidia bacterium]